jgi:hypothetical protein
MKPFLWLVALMCAAIGGRRDSGPPSRGHLVLEATPASAGGAAVVAMRRAAIARAAPGAERAALSLVSDSVAVIPLRRRRPHGLVWLVLAAAMGAGVTGWLMRRAPPS